MSLGKFLFSLAVCWFCSKFNHSGQGISWPVSSLALSHHSDTRYHWDFLLNPGHEKPIPARCSLLASKGCEVFFYLFIWNVNPPALLSINTSRGRQDSCVCCSVFIHWSWDQALQAWHKVRANGTQRAKSRKRNQLFVLRNQQCL